MKVVSVVSVLPIEVIDAATRGWRLFPIRFLGKQPLITDWRNRATNDLSALEVWVQEFPQSNWGVATGQPSGIFVVDVDGDAGRATVAMLERQGLVLPGTLTVTTGRADGGEHRYYRMPLASDIHNDQSGKLGAHIDIKGTGGLVVCPPSTHKSGKLYRYIDRNAAIAEPPDWLINRLSAPFLPANRSAKLRIGELVEGTRNDGMTRYAGALRRRGANREELENALNEANLRRCIPPLPEREILKITESVVRYPVGGPDPLECAFAAIELDSHANGYQRFLALVAELQRMRPAHSIALPLKRIGELLGCDWTQARRWRQYAVRDGKLKPSGRYIPHVRAGHYCFLGEGQATCPTKPLVVQVVVHLSSPSGTADRFNDSSSIFGWESQCGGLLQ